MTSLPRERSLTLLVKSLTTFVDIFLTELTAVTKQAEDGIQLFTEYFEHDGYIVG